MAVGLLSSYDPYLDNLNKLSSELSDGTCHGLLELGDQVCVCVCGGGGTPSRRKGSGLCAGWFFNSMCVVGRGMSKCCGEGDVSKCCGEGDVSKCSGEGDVSECWEVSALS